MSIRSHVKAWTPPVITEARRRWLGHNLRFSDAPGSTWADALRGSKGYAAELILERVADATREVVAGRALYERDSILFHEPDFRYPILAALLRAAMLNDGCLEVVDFGGSLGSTYRQCRPFLQGLRHIRWRVVEQANFVARGQREFSTDELSFIASVSDSPVSEVPVLILLSSVMQYLEQPHQVLDELLRLSASWIVIDRTPMSALDEDRLCIQHVPSTIYDASYPCWALSRGRLRSRLTEAGWSVLGEFPGLEGAFVTPAGLNFEFRGLIAEKV
jgi:putative methyltransferase (TIGR04325 family)